MPWSCSPATCRSSSRPCSSCSPRGPAPALSIPTRRRARCSTRARDTDKAWLRAAAASGHDLVQGGHRESTASSSPKPRGATVAPANAFDDVDTPEDRARTSGMRVVRPLSDAPVRRPVTAVQVLAVGADSARDRDPTSSSPRSRWRSACTGPVRSRRPLAVTMRTPGNDFELAAGFCRTEGLVARPPTTRHDRVLPRRRGRAALQRRDACGCAGRSSPTIRERRFLANSSCGICGKAALDEIEVRCEPVGRRSGRRRDRWCGRCPARLAEHQRVFGETGGLHAAARFTAAGELRRGARRRRPPQRARQADRRTRCSSGALPLADEVLLVSGRLSFELVQKAAVAGIPVLCAVSAPSSLAVAAAERFGQTVVGFLRDDRFNVYTHPERIDIGRLTSMAFKRRKRGDDLVHSAEAAAARPVGRLEAERDGRAEAATTTATSRKVVWENRRNLPWAWRILRKGVCDGCALGVAGFHDWTISGVHLCTTRLELLKVNTARAIARRRACRRRRADAAQRARAARARPARVPDGAAPRRARLPARVVGRRARPRRGADPGRRARSPRDLPHRTRHHQRGVLRRAEGGAVHRHEQRRQRGARVSRAVDHRAEGDARRRGHDVLLPRRHRQRSHRAVRCRRRQRAAGVHEVPVPREEARREASRSSTRSASRGSSATGCRPTSRARCSARR